MDFLATLSMMDLENFQLQKGRNPWAWTLSMAIHFRMDLEISQPSKITFQSLKTHCDLKMTEGKNNQITVSTDCSQIWWLKKTKEKIVYFLPEKQNNKILLSSWTISCTYLSLCENNFVKVDFLRLRTWSCSLLEIAHQPPSPKLFCTWCSCTLITQYL